MKIETISDLDMIIAGNNQWLNSREQAAKKEEMFAFSQAEHDRNSLLNLLDKASIACANTALRLHNEQEKNKHMRKEMLRLSVLVDQAIKEIKQ